MAAQDLNGNMCSQYLSKIGWRISKNYLYLQYLVYYLLPIINLPTEAVQQRGIVSTVPLEVINGGPWSVGSFPERDNTNFVLPNLPILKST